MEKKWIDGIVATFKWADKNFPLAVRLLQMAKHMSDTQLQQIPGIEAFLEIVSEAVRYHARTERLRTEGVTGDNLKNDTINEIVADIIKKYNISKSDVPIVDLNSVAEKAQNIPGVSDLIQLAKNVEVDGVPFLSTMINILEPVVISVPASQLTNTTGLFAY